jgi:hypothetical protein
MNEKVTWKKVGLLIVFILVSSFATGIAKMINRNSDVSNQEDSKISTKNNYIAGCTAQGASEEQCECGFNKVIEKYDYSGFNEIIKETVKDTNSSDTIANAQSQKVKDFIDFMKTEVAESCK